MPLCDIIQNVSQAPFKCLSKWIKVDKWDYFANPSQEFKNYFCWGFLWIPTKTWRQNWRRPIFSRFNLVKYKCVIQISYHPNCFWIAESAEKDFFPYTLRVNQVVGPFWNLCVCEICRPQHPQKLILFFWLLDPCYIKVNVYQYIMYISLEQH